MRKHSAGRPERQALCRGGWWVGGQALCTLLLALPSGCATVAELRKRGDDFWGEFEFYLSDLLVGAGPSLSPCLFPFSSSFLIPPRPRRRLLLLWLPLLLLRPPFCCVGPRASVQYF